MFIRQEFLKSYKNKVTNMYFIQVDLNDINFLQAYFVNKFGFFLFYDEGVLN